MSNPQSPWGNYQFASGPSGSGRSQPESEPVDGCAYRALGLGLGSIVLMVCGVIGAVMGVFAVINGLQAAQMENPTNKTLGIVGMVLGGIGVLASVGMAILYTFLIMAAG